MCVCCVLCVQGSAWISGWNSYSNNKQNLLSLTKQLSYSAMIIVTDFRISTLAVSVSGVAPGHTINDHMLVTC